MFLRGARRTSLLPAKAWSWGDTTVIRWYGLSKRELIAAAERWRHRTATEIEGGASMCEAHAGFRLEAMLPLVAADPRDQVRFAHPLASDDVRRAYFLAPLQNRHPSPGHHRDKWLLRLVGRTILPSALTESPKIGTANQVGVLRHRSERGRDAVDRRASEWLGFTLDGAFERPDRLPASLGLDWAQTHALVVWARAAIIP
jgi:hypothetical protein